MTKHALTGSREEMPEWLQDNEFIHLGYRLPGSFPRISLSLVRRHNETLNIWSHLLGAIGFLVLLASIGYTAHVSNAFARSLHDQLLAQRFAELLDEVHDQTLYAALERADATRLVQAAARQSTVEHYRRELISLAEKVAALQPVKSEFQTVALLASNHTEKILAHADPEKSRRLLKECLNSRRIIGLLLGKITSPISTLPIFVFLLSVVFCLVCSSLFHWCHPLSHRAFRFLRTMDYMGISLHIPAASLANYQYVFYCQRFFRGLYSLGIVAIGLLVFAVNSQPVMSLPRYKKLRTALFGVLGFSNLIPGVHGIVLVALADEQNAHLPLSRGLLYILLMTVCYACGLFFYASKYPERRHPKKFDIWCSSHSIWHMWTLGGMVFCWLALLSFYQQRLRILCRECHL